MAQEMAADFLLADESGRMDLARDLLGYGFALSILDSSGLSNLHGADAADLLENQKIRFIPFFSHLRAVICSFYNSMESRYIHQLQRHRAAGFTGTNGGDGFPGGKRVDRKSTRLNSSHRL